MKPADAAYGALLAVRLALAFAPGYLHPDEYFQSFEPAATAVLDVHTEPVWEWASEPAPAASWPIRSWLVPMLGCGVPMRAVDALARALQAEPFLDGAALLWATRLWMCTLSLVQDACLLCACRALAWPARPTLLAFASC